MNKPGVVRHSSQYFLARGVPGLVNLLALAIYSRMLNTADYGRYTLVVATVALLNLVIFNWLKLGLLRFFPGADENPRHLLSAVGAGYLAAVFFTALAAAGVALLYPSAEVRHFLLLGLGLLWLMAWLELDLELFRARLDPIGYGRLSGLRAVVGLGAGAGLVLAGWQAKGPLTGLLLANMVPALWLLRRHWRGVRPLQPDRVLLKNLLRYGLPLSATASLSFVLALSDRFMIKRFLTEEQVGLYAVGYDLAHNVLAVICMTIGLAATPLAINALKTAGWPAARAQFLDNGRMFLTVSIPATVGLLVVAHGAVDLVVGVDFRSAAYQVYPWIVAATFLQSFKFYYLDSAFFLHKYTGRLLFTVIPAAVLNVGLNYLWLPEYGYIAAAWSTILSYGLAFGITLLYVVARLRMPLPWGVLVRATLAAAVMAAVLLLLRQVFSGHLVLDILLGGSVYALVGWALGLPLLRDLVRSLQERWRSQ